MNNRQELDAITSAPQAQTFIVSRPVLHSIFGLRKLMTKTRIMLERHQSISLCQTPSAKTKNRHYRNRRGSHPLRFARLPRDGHAGGPAGNCGNQARVRGAGGYYLLHNRPHELRPAHRELSVRRWVRCGGGNDQAGYLQPILVMEINHRGWGSFDIDVKLMLASSLIGNEVRCFNLL